MLDRLGVYALPAFGVVFHFGDKPPACAGHKKAVSYGNMRMGAVSVKIPMRALPIAFILLRKGKFMIAPIADISKIAAFSKPLEGLYIRHLLPHSEYHE